jgi:hypothetical protein
MENKGKYCKYISEVNPTKFISRTDVKGYKPSEVNHYDYRDNVEAPHFMEVHIRGTDRSSVGEAYGIGQLAEFPNPSIYYSAFYKSTPHRSWPNSHLDYEIYGWISVNHDNIDDVGGTYYTWLGEGEQAEAYVINKPTIILIPPKVVHKPSYTKEVHGPYMSLALLDSPLQAIIPSREILPPGFENVQSEGWIPPVPKPKAKRKYGKYFSEINVRDLPVYPAHKGKLARVMYYDGSYNAETPFSLDCHLIYGSGLGFGLGDAKKLPVLSNGKSDETSSYEPFLPHRHPYYQTFSFSPTDTEHFPDLGGTVEFWIGEGDEAEKYIITKATNVLIPKHTVHLPLYVREVHKPFTILTILDSSMWAGCWAEKFPPDFKL